MLKNRYSEKLKQMIYEKMRQGVSRLARGYEPRLKTLLRDMSRSVGCYSDWDPVSSSD